MKILLINGFVLPFIFVFLTTDQISIIQGPVFALAVAIIRFVIVIPLNKEVRLSITVYC